jgi:hypothetical protein
MIILQLQKSIFQILKNKKSINMKILFKSHKNKDFT